MKKNWFETWFHSPYYELLYYHRDREEARLFIDNLLNYLQPSPQAVFLDLACGSGRHAIYIASKGFDVTGVDLSDELIEKARAHEHERLAFFVHDMRNVFRTNYFDFTLNLFTSFGYFESEHDNHRVVRNVFDGLKPGGIFVLDFFNAEYTLASLVKEETKRIGNIEFHITRALEDGYIVKRISVHDSDKTFQFMERVRAFTRQELEAHFTEAGFEIIERFGSYRLEKISDKSDRLILIARKNHA